MCKGSTEKEYKKILLLKVPHCPYPEDRTEGTDFRTRNTFRPVPSLALVTLCAFIDQYKTTDYSLKAVDINIEGYSHPNEPINEKRYIKLIDEAVKLNSYDVALLPPLN